MAVQVVQFSAKPQFAILLVYIEVHTYIGIFEEVQTLHVCIAKKNV